MISTLLYSLFALDQTLAGTGGRELEQQSREHPPERDREAEGDIVHRLRAGASARSAP